LISISCSGQDIVIPDYKGENESFSKLKDKIIRKEIATFTIAGAKENNLSLKLKQLPLKKFGDNYSTFEKDSIVIKLTVGQFIKANHKIKYIGGEVVKIDNKPIWGTDGELPKEQINSIYVRIGKDTVIIPKSAYQDLFEPSLKWKEANKTKGHLWVYYSKDHKRFYIAMSNSDGAGFYEATLIIKDKKYCGRVLDTGF
jgi:hypothetical protein